MDSTADLVVFEILHLECLHDDTLSCKGCVTVDLNGDNTLTIDLPSTEEVLLCSCATHNDRVHCLQMRWIRQHRQLDVFSCLFMFADKRCSEMVFCIARALETRTELLIRCNTLDLSHYDIFRLLHNMGQRLETTSMCHANNECFGSMLAARVNSVL